MSGKSNRRIVIVRHGERVDHRFQDVWVEQCFDKDGNYSRQNLNQPEHLPKRKGYPETFIRDSPLTEIGLLQATLRGRGLASENVLPRPDFEVYSSPSLRCLQTATNILKSMKTTKAIKTEPALFEWTNIQWYLNGNMPKWMSPEDLVDAGFDVDTNYVPYIERQDMKEGESVDNYYDRSHQALLHILHAAGDKDVLLIGHGFSLEMLTRQFLGFPKRSEEEMLGVVKHVPYCGMLVLEQDEELGRWDILPSTPRLQLKHASAHDFDASKTFLKSTHTENGN